MYFIIFNLTLDRIIFSGSLLKAYEFLEKSNIDIEEIFYENFPEEKLILPGFIDSHLHPYNGIIQKHTPSLSNAKNLEDFLLFIKSHIEKNPNKSFYIFTGFYDTIFKNFKEINYFILDKISSEKYIIILRYDMHAILVNSNFLNLLKDELSTNHKGVGKFDKESIDFLQEKITTRKNCQKFSENDYYLLNTYNGYFHDEAVSMILKKIPKHNKDEKRNFLSEACNYLLSLGITSFMDAAVNVNNIETYLDLYSKKDILYTLPRA